MQLEDIMKFQKMELISAGTDFDVIRYSAFLSPFSMRSFLAIGKLLPLAISIRLRGSRVSGSS